jgi:hypothetical protein
MSKFEVSEEILEKVEHTLVTYQSQTSEQLVEAVNRVLKDASVDVVFNNEKEIATAMEDANSVLSWCTECAYIGQDNDHLDKGLCYDCAMMQDEDETLSTYR